jgi:hypothetical protein
MLIFFRKHYAHASLFLTIPIKTAIYAKAMMELCRMQLVRARQSLGFVNKKRSQSPFYVFIGQEDHLEDCRQLAMAKGLDAEFHEGDSQSLPNGHLNMPLPTERNIYAVYDTSAYSFEDIFQLFARQSFKNVKIGTYLPEFNTIVTTAEILK